MNLLWIHSLFADALRGHFYHPQLRYRRPGRFYPADSRKAPPVVQAQTSVEGEGMDAVMGDEGMQGSLPLEPSVYEPAALDRCTKQVQWSKSLTPGLFTCVCIHGICYGFSFMREHESPKTAFDVMYHRMRLPTFACYDNCCHLDRYCRAREPGAQCA